MDMVSKIRHNARSVFCTGGWSERSFSDSADVHELLLPLLSLFGWLLRNLLFFHHRTLVRGPQ
jgi:hypothetical protein